MWMGHGSHAMANPSQSIFRTADCTCSTSGRAPSAVAISATPLGWVAVHAASMARMTGIRSNVYKLFTNNELSVTFVARSRCG